MAKTEGKYIRVMYKNVFGYISTNSWPSFMIQRPTIREKCAWVRSNTWWHERSVATGLDRFFFGFSISWQMSQLATEKIQNLCNRNWWSSLLQLGSVRFRSFFQSSELDLRTLLTNVKSTAMLQTVMVMPQRPLAKKQPHRKYQHWHVIHSLTQTVPPSRRRTPNNKNNTDKFHVRSTNVSASKCLHKCEFLFWRCLSIHSWWIATTYHVINSDDEELPEEEEDMYVPQHEGDQQDLEGEDEEGGQHDLEELDCDTLKTRFTHEVGSCTLFTAHY